MSDDAGLAPHDTEAEQITLGSMMIAPAVLGEIIEIIPRADVHYLPSHQVVHEAILRLYQARQPTDATAVRLELERRGQMVGRLDADYLHTLIAAVPAAASGPYYARQVARFAEQRRMIEGLTSALQAARTPSTWDPVHDGEGGANLIRRLVDDASADPGTGNAVWLADAVLAVADKLDQPLPPDEISPPYADLRHLIRALHPGQLITVAARPSIGKTVVAGDFARHVALRLGLPAIWFSLEMSEEEIVTRTLAAEARVSHELLQEHALGEHEWERISTAVKCFAESRLLIDDQSGCDLGYIRTRLRSMARTAPARLVIVDYLQLATSPGAPSRQEEISRLARGLKDLASEFGVPVLMAAQLNRNPESRHDKRPLQSDLRESGEIENSSDIVILLHREDYYEPESPRAGEMDLIVSKNRNGRTGQVTVAFQGRFCRCVGMARDDLPPSGHWTASSRHFN